MSKFKGLFDATKDKDSESDSQATPLQTEISSPIKPSRSVGKRSNPAFEQVTAYIRKDTYRKAKIRLLQEDKGREFSELVEDLLAQWVATNL